MIQAEPAFLLLNQDKRRHCSQGGWHKASLRKCAFLLAVGIMSVPSAILHYEMSMNTLPLEYFIISEYFLYILVNH